VWEPQRDDLRCEEGRDDGEMTLGASCGVALRGAWGVQRPAELGVELRGLVRCATLVMWL
jgi:hypothetical protein